MPMPLIKIGYLLVRTVAKPIASGIKGYSKNHPRFRSACVRMAQLYHRAEVRMRRRIAAKNGEDVSSATVKPLDEAKAVELGADFLGEAIVFGIAGGVLIADASRNAVAESNRRKAIEEKFDLLFSQMEALSQRMQNENKPN